MSDQIKNLMIGIFVLVATCIVIFILMFLNPRVGDKGKVLLARFTNIDKVTLGTRVTYAGKPVGEVIGIKEVEFGREGRKDSGGHIYLYELKLRVDSKVNVFNSDEVSVRTSGLLGEKNVEISPMAPLSGVVLKQVDDQVIYGMETGSVEDALKGLKDVSSKLETALDTVTDTLNRIKDTNVIENVSRVADNVASITNSLNNPQQLTDILENIHILSQKANDSWENVDKTFLRIDTAAHSVDLAGQSLNTAGLRIQELMSDGQVFIRKYSEAEGSFNKLFLKDDLYLRTNSILSKFETVMDDINHYGLLFSSDKGWQRLRARRLNLLQKLSTPQEFRNYFNDEIDQISTSISRVSMVLDKAATDPYCNDRMQDREFTKVFSELMRRVSMLEEEVRLYNTQVVESQTYQTELEPPQMCRPPSN